MSRLELESGVGTVGGFRPVSGIFALKLSESVWICLEHVDGGEEKKSRPEVVIFVELEVLPDGFTAKPTNRRKDKRNTRLHTAWRQKDCHL
jgi:hypothetical protein